MKKSRCIKSYIWVAFLLNTLILSGCIQPNNSRYPDKIHEVLKLSHNNRKEIEKALDFFINQKDSLKIRSIFFLVGNMADKYSLTPANEQDPFHSIILNNHIKEKEAWDPGKSRLGIALDSVYKTCTDPPRPKIVRDIEVITGNFLINNVEEAIKIWHRTKKFTECSFDDFCEYILPYRIGNESLSDWREQAYQKFSYLLDSISDPLELTKAIVQVSGIYYNAGMSKYPFFPTFSELDQLHVDISHKGCKYSIDLPSGWDTIPHDTLKKIFPRLDLDMGLYPVSQKEYFTGNYALVGFMPVLQSLHSYSFDRIVSDMKEMNDRTKNTWNNDSISTRLDSIVPVNSSPNYRINNYLTIRRDSILLKGCQSLYVSKFGYITLMLYQKGNDALPIDSLLGKFNDSGCLKVDQEYRYTPPQKEGLSFTHFLYALGIGGIVYLLIAFFPKRKTNRQ